VTEIIYRSPFFWEKIEREVEFPFSVGVGDILTVGQFRHIFEQGYDFSSSEELMAYLKQEKIYGQ